MATYPASKKAAPRALSLLMAAAALALMLLPALLAPAALALPEALPITCPTLLLNTGTTGWDANATFSVNAPGDPDLKWTLTTVPTGAVPPAVTTTAYSGWQVPSGGETWITPASTVLAPITRPIPVPELWALAPNAPAGIYTYDFHFAIPGDLIGEEPPCGPSWMELCFAADNKATIYLNTVQVGVTAGSPTPNHGFKAWSCISVDSSGPWSFGPNLLRAEVYNAGGPTGYIARGALNV